MPKLNHMSRVLCSHDWKNVEEWVHALNELATLTDGEISELETLAAPRTKRFSRDQT